MEYEKAVRKTFPDLKELDGVAISSNLPLAPKPNHVPAQFAGLVTAFVTKYLAALNEPNRPNLRFAFFERSMFSLTIMLGGADRFHKTYVQLNRNLKGGKLKAGKEVNTLLFGAAIAPALQTFPTARYDPASCKVDVWQASAQAIGLNIAGEFQEVDEKNGVSNRPFHRVMILMLTKPGMPAHTAGWPAVIANEQLHIGSG
eukprot:gene28267-28348_t